MYPTIKAIWYLCYNNNPNSILHFLSMICLHYIPAIFMDIICVLIGKKPRMLRTYKKIHKFMNVIEYFSMREWDFDTYRVANLWNQLSAKDQKIFFFDMKQLNWDHFMEYYFCGIRQHLLHDPIETVPAALKRWNRLYWLHQLVKLIIGLLIVKISVSLVKLIFF